MPSDTSLRLTDPKLTALALALGGHLAQVDQLPSGHLEFVLTGVPNDLERRLLNDTLKVSAKKFIDAMEGVLTLIAQNKTRRARGDASTTADQRPSPVRKSVV